MHPDPWLQRWLPLVQTQVDAGHVLEIGCGAGEDTAVLAAAGLRVLAFDLSATEVALARARVPAADIRCLDLRAPLPLGPGQADVVVASLSLHYFDWSQTLDIVQRIHGVLRPGGLLLCRLNSTQDHHFGASGHPQIAPHYYLVDGSPKRFFDEHDVQTAFADGWTHIALAHLVTHKYGKPKALWELVAQKSA